MPSGIRSRLRIERLVNVGELHVLRLRHGLGELLRLLWLLHDLGPALHQVRDLCALRVSLRDESFDLGLLLRDDRLVCIRLLRLRLRLLRLRLRLRLLWLSLLLLWLRLRLLLLRFFHVLISLKETADPSFPCRRFHVRCSITSGTCCPVCTGG